MDIKKSIEEIVEKLKKDDGLKDKFLKDPAGTLKQLTGIDIPTDKISSLVDGVKAKLAADSAGDAVKGVADKLGGLFGKK